MTPEKVKLLCNGIASIADALDTPFADVLDDMVTMDIITNEQEEAVWTYMSAR